MDQGARSQHVKGARRQKKKKGAPAMKVPRILSYLFQHGGLAEKGIPQLKDGFVKISDILDIYSDYTEEDVYGVISSGSVFITRECPETGDLQMQLLEQVNIEGSSHQSEHSAASCQNKNPTTIAEPLAVDYRGERSSDRRHKVRASQDIQLSKFLSWLLRHGAAKEHLTLQDGGFLYVEDILVLPKMKGKTVKDIQRVVCENDKQRFHMEPHPENGRLRIRANQGHTVKVIGLEMQPIRTPDQFPSVVHGTYLHCWENIKTQGLSRMRRTHVHFAPGEPGESGVISGMRGTCDVLIYINLAQALNDGLEFFVSSNNVILSPGDEDGFVKPRYFAAAWRRNPRVPLSLT